MSAGFFDTQLSRLDGALLELSGTGGRHSGAPDPFAQALMRADNSRLIAELRGCRDALRHGSLRRAFTRLLSRHEALAAQLNAFSLPS